MGKVIGLIGLENFSFFFFFLSFFFFPTFFFFLSLRPSDSIFYIQSVDDTFSLISISFFHRDFFFSVNALGLFLKT
ncbi:hypothetical protein F5B20DRAFT_540289 [Whalleya microplaca]|nr:hypothetical protein F5B20DRAFT_540289 [Whalleya microplaca]